MRNRCDAIPCQRTTTWPTGDRAEPLVARATVDPPRQTVSAASTKELRVPIRRIASIVDAFVPSRASVQTRYASERARLTATFRRLLEKRKSAPRLIASPSEVVIEKKTTGASRPWNLSTVPTEGAMAAVRGSASNTRRMASF